MTPKPVVLMLLMMTLFASSSALPCSGTPPALGEVNLSRDTMVPNAPLWIEVSSTSQDAYPFVILNLSSNQPISYTIIHKHTNPGAFASTHYKLEPHVGIWGDEGDIITVGVDENAPDSWLIMPSSLPQIELDYSLDMDETLALPGMWPEESISITEVPPNSCYPTGAWRIYVPFQVYEETILWGILETYTDNQEGPVFMKSVFGHQLAATDGARYAFNMTEDPGRCIRIIPSNVNGTQFEGLEYCLPQEDVVDAGVSSMDAGMFALDAGNQDWVEDSGLSDITDAGREVPDGGSEAPTALDAGAGDRAAAMDADAGVDADTLVDNGCGCSQRSSKSFLPLSGMVFAFGLWRRKRSRLLSK